MSQEPEFLGVAIHCVITVRSTQPLPEMVPLASFATCATFWTQPLAMLVKQDPQLTDSDYLQTQQPFSPHREIDRNTGWWFQPL